LLINQGEISRLLFKRINTLAVLVVMFLLSNASLLSAGEIVVVKSSDIKPYNDALEGFKRTCRCTVRELNLPETGQNNIQNKILEIGPDAVLAIGMDALNSVGKIDNLPIFYTMLTELMPEFAEKRKKYSGTSMDILPETYLSYMARLFPKARRVGIIYSKRNTGQFVNEALAISNSIGFEIIVREVSTPARVPAVIESMKGKIDIFWMLPDTEVISSETVDSILLFSFQNNVPVFSFSNKYVKMGAMASLSVDPVALGAQTGALVAKKVDKGAVENHVHIRPQKVLLYVNRRIAAKFGLTLGDEIVRNADEVY
jgi:putative ABC transport system substrate-binding protein